MIGDSVVQMLEFVYISFTLRDCPKEMNEQMKRVHYQIFNRVTQQIMQADLADRDSGKHSEAVDRASPRRELYYPVNTQSMFKLCTLIKLSYLAENRALRTNKYNSFELLDMIITFMKHLQQHFESTLPRVGVNFVIETFKLMRFEVMNDERQIMLSSLLDFLEAYIDFFVRRERPVFSEYIVGLDTFIICEVIDTSRPERNR